MTIMGYTLAIASLSMSLLGYPVVLNMSQSIFSLTAIGQVRTSPWPRQDTVGEGRSQGRAPYQVVRAASKLWLLHRETFVLVP